MNRISIPCAAVLALAGVAAPAQTPASKPQFEVASIKPADPAGRGFRIGFEPGGRFVASGITVNFLIQEAYGVRQFQITGAPGWFSSARFDITAKPDAETAAAIQKSGGDPGAGESPMAVMIQGLLADRFQLKVTRETKELPVYNLVIAKGGLKIKEVEVPKIDEAESGAGGGRGEGPGRGGPGRGGSQMRMGRGLISFKAGPIRNLATLLANQLGRTVIDKTGLSGAYDFELKWMPDASQQPLGPKEAGGPETAPAGDSSGPSIFTALEELGLKLESGKGPVEILVIDHAEKPTEN